MPTRVNQGHVLGVPEGLGCEGCTVQFLWLGAQWGLDLWLLVGEPASGSQAFLFQCGQALETQRGGRYRAQIIPNNKHPTSPKSTRAFSSLQSKPQTDSAPQLSFLTSGDGAARPLLGLRKGCVSAHTHTHTQKPTHPFQHSVIYKVVVGPRAILFQKQPIGSDGMSRPFARPHDSSPGAESTGSGWVRLEVWGRRALRAAQGATSGPRPFQRRWLLLAASASLGPACSWPGGLLTSPWTLTCVPLSSF